MTLPASFWLSITPSAAPVLLMIVASLILKLTGGGFPYDPGQAPDVIGSRPSAPRSPTQIAAEFRARLAWQSGSSVLLVAIIGMLGVWFTLSVRLLWDNGIPAMPYVIFIAVLALVAGVLMGLGPLGSATRQVLSSQPWSGLCRPLDLWRWQWVGIGAGFVAPVGLIFAVCILLRVGLDAVPGVDTRTLARVMWLLWGAGAAAAVLLVTGVSVTYLYMSWPAAVQPEKTARAILDLAATTSFAYGVLLTALLAGVYLPAAALLSHHAATFVPVGTDSPKEWLESHGLAWSTTEHLVAAAAVLGPFLAGLASGPISRLVKPTAD